METLVRFGFTKSASNFSFRLKFGFTHSFHFQFFRGESYPWFPESVVVDWVSGWVFGFVAWLNICPTNVACILPNFIPNIFVRF